jgi:hypothetical protein
MYGSLGIGFAIQFALVIYIGAVITPIIGIFVLKAIDPSLSKLGYSTEEWGKLVVYTSLPYLAAGILMIIPVFGMQWLQGLAGLYGLYLFFYSLTKVKKVKQDVVIPLIIAYFVILSVITWVVYFQIVNQLVMSAIWGFLY